LEHVELKQACISGVIALDLTTSCVASGDNQGKKGIVVTSDIARYDRHQSGEYTQGAGAVAMLVTEDPRLIEFERRVKAMFTKNENDFFRPIGKDTAVVYGHSNDCYLNAMREVMESYKKKVVAKGLIVPGEGETVTDYFDYLNFHLPYPRMAEYAAAFLFRHEWRNLPRWKSITADLGCDEPKRSNYVDINEFLKADKEFRKKFVKHHAFQKVYKEKVEPSVVLSKQIGNIYTGSLFLGFMSTLEVEYKRGVDLAGKRFGFGAYGSGLEAMVFSGKIRPANKEIVSRFNMIEELATRTEIDLDTYEKLHKRELKEPILKGPGFVLQEIMPDGYRIYDYNKG
jgi:hydroxymethylglutaryl-CoA synthase